MDDPKQPISTYVASALAVMVTATLCACTILGIAVPETFSNFVYAVVGGAIGIGAAQWQARR